MIDWNKPIEAVEKATGKVVPMTFSHKRGNWGNTGMDYYTTDSPNDATSNNGWNADGSDHCGQNAWYVRNVAEETLESLLAFKARALAAYPDLAKSPRLLADEQKAGDLADEYAREGWDVIYSGFLEAFVWARENNS